MERQCSVTLLSLHVFSFPFVIDVFEDALLVGLDILVQI